VLNHSAHNSILDFALMQVDADFVTDLELSIVWLPWDWDAKECTKNRVTRGPAQRLIVEC